MLIKAHHLNKFLSEVSPWVVFEPPKNIVTELSDNDFLGCILAFQSLRQLYAINANVDDVFFSLGEPGEYTFIVDFANFENNNTTFPTVKCRKPIIYFTKLPNFIFDKNLHLNINSDTNNNFTEVMNQIDSYIDGTKESKEVYIYLASRWKNENQLPLFSEDITSAISKVKSKGDIIEFFVYDNLPSWNELVKRLVDVMNKPFKANKLPSSVTKLNKSSFETYLKKNDFTSKSLQDFFIENIKAKENNFNDLYLEAIAKNRIVKFPLQYYSWQNKIQSIVKFAQLNYNALAFWLATGLTEQLSFISSNFWKAKMIMNYVLSILSYNILYYSLKPLGSPGELQLNNMILKVKKLPKQFEKLNDHGFIFKIQPNSPYTWSLNQIEYLVKHYRTQDLIALINKIVFTKTSTTKHIQELILSSNNDLDLYRKLHSESKPKAEYNRGVNRVEELKNFSVFEELKKRAAAAPFKYLDFGGQNGEIAFEIAKELGINNKEQCFVYDIESWFDTEMKGNKDVTYNFSRTNILPYQDNSFDFITVLMVIHHIKYPEFILHELYRILKPNGTIIFREHDSDGESTDVLIDVEHSLFEVVEKKEPNLYALESYYAHYYSKEKFISLIESIGLGDGTFSYNQGDLVKNSTRDPKIPVGPTRYYYSIFTKSKDKFDWVNTLNPFFNLTSSQSLFLELKRREMWNNIINLMNTKVKMLDKDLKLLLLRYFFNKNNNYNNFVGEVEQNGVVRKQRNIVADPVFLTNQCDEAVDQLIKDFEFQKLGSKTDAINLSYLIDSEFYKASKAIKEFAMKPKSATYSIENGKVIYDGITIPDEANILASLSTDSNIDIYALLWLRYNYIALGTQGLSMIYEDFKIKDKSKVVEAFAGAFNHYFKNWGSAFPEEIQLGSFGNFFEVIKFSSTVVTFFINPPFDEAVMAKTFEKVLEIAELTPKAKFIITVPDWKDVPSYEYLLSAIEQYQHKVKKYKKNEYQYINRFTNEKINAVDTLEIIFETP